MSASAAQADAFFREVSGGDTVWTVEDDRGVPAPRNRDGSRAMPFWSRALRARRITEQSVAYLGFRVREIPMTVWLERWLPGLEADGILVGLNWSGERATGFDLDAASVRAKLAPPPSRRT